MTDICCLSLIYYCPGLTGGRSPEGNPRPANKGISFSEIKQAFRPHTSHYFLAISIKYKGEIAENVVVGLVPYWEVRNVAHP